MRPSAAFVIVVGTALAACTPTPPAERPAADRVRGFCGTCHGFTEPGLLPRAAWRPVIERMVQLYDVDGKQALPATLDECVAFYEERAPERLVWPADGWPERGAPWTGSWSGDGGLVDVRALAVADLVGTRRPEVIVANATDGRIASTAEDGWRPIADIAWAACIEVVDLDDDGRLDLIVGTLGREAREDHTDGAVHWLRAAGDGSFERILVAGGLARVEDVAVGDLDGDGDPDLVVAETGYFRGGNLVWYENDVVDGERTFRFHAIDPRAGATDVAIADVDLDGNPDIVAVFGAQFETVVAFLARGRGHFAAQTLFEAPNADFGLRSLVLLDVDSDDDLDAVVTAGDLGPGAVAQPFHGVYLLESDGKYPWDARLLVRMPGARSLAAGDLDGDGDIDLVAGAVRPAGEKRWAELVALIAEEPPGTFAARTVTAGAGAAEAASVRVTDLDRDGHAEIVVGRSSETPVEDGPLKVLRRAE